MTNSPLPPVPESPPPQTLQPSGYWGATLASMNRGKWKKTLEQIGKHGAEDFETNAKAYMSTLGVGALPDREARLATYMLKKAAQWIEQRFYIPWSTFLPNFQDDWDDYTELVKAAIRGEFDKPSTARGVSTRHLATKAYASAQAQIHRAAAMEQLAQRQSSMVQQAGGGL